jgi:hypothetical protein
MLVIMVKMLTIMGRVLRMARGVAGLIAEVTHSRPFWLDEETSMIPAQVCR